MHTYTSASLKLPGTGRGHLDRGAVLSGIRLVNSTYDTGNESLPPVFIRQDTYIYAVDPGSNAADTVPGNTSALSVPAGLRILLSDLH